MEASDRSLSPGYRLDRYELLAPIASGGMASVWLARLRGKRGFEKLFAVKTIKTELISDPHFQEMFLDEARIASRIIHPNVAQIIELGEQDDILYIVMEYVDGDSLAKINRLAVKRGSPLPPGVSLRIIADTCAGLHAAHQLKDANGESLGVVHRDVSPQNILVTTEGAAKVIDFGLVKAKNRGAGETGQGVVKGKIRYMAPEQIGGKGIDHRADIWAMGMCLYELIVGRVPYHELDDLEIVKRLMSDDPLPAFDIALPPPLERILTKAIVKDPAERFDSCAQMRRAIEAAIHELELPGENEHVAEFLKEALPDLANKRSATVTKASEVVAVGAAHGDDLGPADMAFAATEVSRRDASTPDAELPPTRRRPRPEESDPHRSGSSSSSSATRATSTSTLREQLGEEKRRSGVGLLIAGVVVVGAGAWILWPRPEPPANDPRGAGAASASASATAAAATATADAEPAETTLELDAAVQDDAGQSTIELDPSVPEAGQPSSKGQGPTRPPIFPSPSDPSTADTPPPARTYNPAWSILTNPPDAAFINAPPSATTAAPPLEPPPLPPDEPK